MTQWLRRLRAFLDLRQTDVERATGIPVYRISAAENGKIKLNPVEQQLLSDFLRDRLRLVAQAEGWKPDALRRQQ